MKEEHIGIFASLYFKNNFIQKLHNTISPSAWTALSYFLSKFVKGEDIIFTIALSSLKISGNTLKKIINGFNFLGLVSFCQISDLHSKISSHNFQILNANEQFNKLRLNETFKINLSEEALIKFAFLSEKDINDIFLRFNLSKDIDFINKINSLFLNRFKNSELEELLFQVNNIFLSSEHNSIGDMDYYINLPECNNISSNALFLLFYYYNRSSLFLLKELLKEKELIESAKLSRFEGSLTDKENRYAIDFIDKISLEFASILSHYMRFKKFKKLFKIDDTHRDWELFKKFAVQLNDVAFGYDIEVNNIFQKFCSFLFDEKKRINVRLFKTYYDSFIVYLENEKVVNIEFNETEKDVAEHIYEIYKQKLESAVLRSKTEEEKVVLKSIRNIKKNSKAYKDFLICAKNLIDSKIYNNGFDYGVFVDSQISGLAFTGSFPKHFHFKTENALSRYIEYTKKNLGIKESLMMRKEHGAEHDKWEEFIAKKIKGEAK
ncbi:hypothetical protein M0R19_06190 [Candidatus Pacearchaeota archaeon]|nr:hypothetical protein [Candidatus Pacearchaeota archaeon]